MVHGVKHFKNFSCHFIVLQTSHGAQLRILPDSWQIWLADCFMNFCKILHMEYNLIMLDKTYFKVSHWVDKMLLKAMLGLHSIEG